MENALPHQHLSQSNSYKNKSEYTLCTKGTEPMHPASCILQMSNYNLPSGQQKHKFNENRQSMVLKDTGAVFLLGVPTNSITLLTQKKQKPESMNDMPGSAQML